MLVTLSDVLGSPSHEISMKFSVLNNTSFWKSISIFRFAFCFELFRLPHIINVLQNNLYTYCAEQFLIIQHECNVNSKCSSWKEGHSWYFKRIVKEDFVVSDWVFWKLPCCPDTARSSKGIRSRFHVTVWWNKVMPVLAEVHLGSCTWRWF